MEEVLHIKRLKVYEGKVPHTALKYKLHVDKGEFVAIMGPSGSGNLHFKTLSLQSILRLQVMS